MSNNETKNNEEMSTKVFFLEENKAYWDYIDEDLQGWKDYMPIYPDNWYNGFDPNLVIRGEGLYSVRAIPSLYLLDKEKGVILKDAPENRLLSYLVNL